MGENISLASGSAFSRSALAFLRSSRRRFRSSTAAGKYVMQEKLIRLRSVF
jgi:hypothetical protein